MKWVLNIHSVINPLPFYKQKQKNALLLLINCTFAVELSDWTDSNWQKSAAKPLRIAFMSFQKLSLHCGSRHLLKFQRQLLCMFTYFVHI
jgi:hypothetical protein